MSNNQTTFSVADAANALDEFFAFIKSNDMENFEKFERIVGQPLGMMNIPLSEFHDATSKYKEYDPSFEVKIGNFIFVCHLRNYLTNPQEEITWVRIRIIFEGNILWNATIVLTNGKVSPGYKYNPNIHSVERCIIRKLKTNVTRTLNAHLKYLNDPQFYDMIKHELDIKIK